MLVGAAHGTLVATLRAQFRVERGGVELREQPRLAKLPAWHAAITQAMAKCMMLLIMVQRRNDSHGGLCFIAAKPKENRK
jgi:hypothetical protein